MKRPAPGHNDDPPTIDDVRACIEKRLFIGRLPREAREEELWDVYGSFEGLTECRLLPEKGVAFVGFDTWGSAHKALLATDGKAPLASCKGLPISVNFAERKDAVRGAASQLAKSMDISRLFVGNLPEASTDPDLRALFEPYGRVEAGNLLAAKSHRRCGFVNFASWGEAMDAIEALDGQIRAVGDYMCEEPLVVKLAAKRERGDAGGFGGSAKPRRVDGYAAGGGGSRHDPFAGGAAGYRGGGGDPTFESLKAAYCAAVDGDTPAEICDELHCKIMASRPAVRQAAAASPLTSLPPEAADAAVKLAAALGPAAPPQLTALLGGRAGRVEPSVSAVEDRDAARLFVGGLPFEIADDELKALIDQVAPSFKLAPSQCRLLECRVLPGKGCGYIRFSSWEAANLAIEALDERAVTGWKLPLRVRWAAPKQGGVATPPAPAASLQGASAAELRQVASALQALLGDAGGQIATALGGGGNIGRR